MKSAKTTLGRLRKITLQPAPTADDKPEADHLVALRRTLEIHRDVGDEYRLVVPPAIAELLPADKPAKVDKPAA